jgi:hypothetical protein
MDHVFFLFFNGVFTSGGGVCFRIGVLINSALLLVRGTHFFAGAGSVKKVTLVRIKR